MAEERLIRKYANRRLYDAQESRHVTLDDLRKLIAAGQRIKVVDDKSGTTSRAASCCRSSPTRSSSEPRC